MNNFDGHSVENWIIEQLWADWLGRWAATTTKHDQTNILKTAQWQVEIQTRSRKETIDMQNKRITLQLSHKSRVRRQHCLRNLSFHPVSADGKNGMWKNTPSTNKQPNKRTNERKKQTNKQTNKQAKQSKATKRTNSVSVWVVSKLRTWGNLAICRCVPKLIRELQFVWDSHCWALGPNQSWHTLTTFYTASPDLPNVSCNRQVLGCEKVPSAK